jgi:hypothetical protein
MEGDRIEVGPLQGHQWVTGMMLRSVWARRDGTNGLEAVQTSETSVYCSETTWRYIPEGSYLSKHLFKLILKKLCLC